MTYEKIIFLDVDGVLNSRETLSRARSLVGIDPFMTLLLHRILEATDAKVVVSSAWRLHEESMAEVVKAVHPFEVVGQTPNLPVGIRGDEVNAWLEENEVGRYAILDDYPDFHKNQIVFRTTFLTGLTEEIANEVIEHFKPRESK